MPRAKYDEATKAAIKKAALDARKAGKTWKDAHAAAQSAGYQGSQQGIIKLLRTAGKKGKPGRKPGRPAGSKNKKKPGRPRGSKTAASAPSSDIGALIDKLVSARINEALDKAIDVLKGAKK